MSRLGFLARKPDRADKPIEPPAADNPLELDEELFSARPGRRNTEPPTLDSLLTEAGGKIAELDGIKAALGRLLEPIGKVIGDFQTAQETLRRLESARAQAAADAAVQRGKAADLEKRLAEQTSECIALYEHKQKLEEQLAQATKRNAALEKVLPEAHDLLFVRTEQTRDQSRRNAELEIERDALNARLSELEARLRIRDVELKDAAEAHARVIEQNAALTRAFTAKEAAFTQAQKAIEQLSAALHREKWERAQIEEALQTARRDYASAMRVMVRHPAETIRPPQRVANAA